MEGGRNRGERMRSAEGVYPGGKKGEPSAKARKDLTHTHILTFRSHSAAPEFAIAAIRSRI